MRKIITYFLSVGSLSLLLVVPVATAEVVTFFDDFEREEIGDDWLASGGDWAISETEDFGRVLRSGASSNHVLLFQGFELDDAWEMEMNFHFTRVDGSWSGVTFHAQFDGQIFRNYVSRVRPRGTVEEPEYVSHQFLEFENFGVNDWMTPQPAPETALLTAFVPYRLVVSTTETPGEFDYRIFDEEDELLFEQLMVVGEGGDWSPLFESGWAGLYDIRSIGVHDFRLSVGTPDVEETTFAAWQDAHFTTDQLDDPEISGPEADPAGDGIANVLKYGLNLDPWLSSQHLLPAPAVDEDHLTISYTRLKGASDIEYEVKVSTGLPNWESGPEHVEEVGVEDLGDTERVTVRAVTPIGEEARQFLQLVVARVE